MFLQGVNVKKIKGAANKNSVVDGTRKRVFSSNPFVRFCLKNLSLAIKGLEFC